MLEILFLGWFVRKLAAIAKAKGRSGMWGGLGALFWIGGEIVGVVIGATLDAGAGAYLLALVLAGLGAGVAYFIVSSLKGLELEAPASAPAYAHYDPKNPYSPPRGGEGER